LKVVVDVLGDAVLDINLRPIIYMSFKAPKTAASATTTPTIK
jgi:hypothetical protein